MSLKKRMSGVTGAVILFFAVPLLSAQPPAPKADWQAWKFLLGEWVGAGGGGPGQGAGGSRFYLDLQERVLVRTNYSDFPATQERPAFSHNDLMIIYQDAGGARAVYFDNEGHVIHYAAAFSSDLKTLTFIGDIKPSEPRFRMIYSREPGDRLKLRFEIARPGKPDEFSPYIEAIMKRK